MQESQFSLLAEKTISYIAEQIEEQDRSGIFEVDFIGGDILSIVTSFGEYVINKHSTAREIWLASPMSGPHHFAFTGSEWKTRQGKELFLVLNTELSKLIPLSLEPLK